jgi:uroporphyrinogen-III synthase
MSVPPASVLVTRPREDAQLLTADLERRGVDILLEPLFDIVPIDGTAPDLGDIAGLLFTSANGVRAFAQISKQRKFKVFAVGDATAAAARSAGFSDVDSAGGSVEDLMTLVKDSWTPASGALFHAAGRTVSGELAETLGAFGYEVHRMALYEAKAADALSVRLCEVLRAAKLGYALFFSPRTADTFVSLVTSACLRDACKNVEAICLSTAVADMFSGLNWRYVTVAAEPNQEALLAALDRRLAHTNS